MRIQVILLFTLATAGCATLNDNGWSGSGAQPFDGARTACEAEAASQPAGPERTASFDACMAAKGWHRR